MCIYTHMCICVHTHTNTYVFTHMCIYIFGFYVHNNTQACVSHQVPRRLSLHRDVGTTGAQSGPRALASQPCSNALYKTMHVTA